MNKDKVIKKMNRTKIKSNHIKLTEFGVKLWHLYSPNLPIKKDTDRGIFFAL